MKLDPKIVEAVDAIRACEAEARARRVIRALAENMPEEAVKKAYNAEQTYLARHPYGGDGRVPAIIRGFLNHVGADDEARPEDR